MAMRKVNVMTVVMTVVMIVVMTVAMTSVMNSVMTSRVGVVILLAGTWREMIAVTYVVTLIGMIDVISDEIWIEMIDVTSAVTLTEMTGVVTIKEIYGETLTEKTSEIFAEMVTGMTGVGMMQTGVVQCEKSKITGGSSVMIAKSGVVEHGAETIQIVMKAGGVEVMIEEEAERIHGGVEVMIEALGEVMHGGKVGRNVAVAVAVVDGQKEEGRNVVVDGEKEQGHGGEMTDQREKMEAKTAGEKEGQVRQFSFLIFEMTLLSCHVICLEMNFSSFL